MNSSKGIKELQDAGWFDNFCQDAETNLKEKYLSNFREEEPYPIHVTQLIPEESQDIGDDYYTEELSKSIETLGGGQFEFENYTQEYVEGEDDEMELKISFDLSGKHFEKQIEASYGAWQYFPFMNSSLESIGLRIYDCGWEEPYSLGSIDAGNEIYARKVGRRCVRVMGAQPGEFPTKFQQMSELVAALEKMGWFEGFTKEAKQRVIHRYEDNLNRDRGGELKNLSYIMEATEIGFIDIAHHVELDAIFRTINSMMVGMLEFEFSEDRSEEMVDLQLSVNGEVSNHSINHTKNYLEQVMSIIHNILADYSLGVYWFSNNSMELSVTIGTLGCSEKLIKAGFCPQSNLLLR